MNNSYEYSLKSVRRRMVLNFSLVLLSIASVLLLIIWLFYSVEKSQITVLFHDNYVKQVNEKVFNDSTAPLLFNKITAEYTDVQNNELLEGLGILYGVLFVLSAIPSFLISQSIARKRIYALKRKHFAYFDQLTGLPSCNMLIDRLNHIFAQSRRYNHKFSILYMNIDNFSDINNSWGNLVGNRVLKVIAERLVSTVRTSDTVSYIGDDEFAIILSVVGEKSDSEVVANKILKKMSHPFKHDDEEKYLGVSIGIATYPDDGIDTDSLMNKADEAMIRVKNTVRNSFMHTE